MIGRAAAAVRAAGRRAAILRTKIAAQTRRSPTTPPTPPDAASMELRTIRALESWIDPFSPDASATPPRSLGRFFLWSYRGLGWPLAALVVVSLLAGLTEVAVLAGIGELVDRAQAGAPDAFFIDHGWFLAGLIGVILILRPLVMSIGAFLSAMMVGPSLAPGVIWRLHRHLLGQPLRYFEDDFAGRLTQKEMQAGNAVDVVTIDLVNTVGMLIGFMIGMIGVLAAADWRLGLFVLAWAIAYAVILRWLLPKVRGAAAERAEAQARVSGQLVDAVSNIKTVKLFAAPGVEEKATEQMLRRLRRARLALGAQVTRLRSMLNAMNAVATAVLLLLALLLWTSGAATIGVVAAAAMLTVRLTHMSGWIAFTFLGVFREIGTLEDAIATLAKPYGLTDRENPLSLGVSRIGAASGKERIVFDNVSFSYPRPPETGAAPVSALHRIALQIEPGEKIGLVGPSGAGKSTLIALLARLYDVSEGRILLGGADIRALAQAELRARIGVVTQEAALFNRSARDNIRYGRPDATEEQLHDAAKRARADSFIQELKDAKGRAGYEAHLGERGVKLSGGQRQRIALARAFLKDAPILVLDEATSALDSGVEAEILAAMNELMRGKTVLAIAHRLSTLAAMDRIVVLQDGRIVEEGPHDALLQRGGLYAGLWSRQSGGFLAQKDAAE